VFVNSDSTPSNTFDSSYTDVELDGNGDETGYVYFEITKNVTGFENNVATGSLYLLFNVNNSQIGGGNNSINWVSRDINDVLYETVYKRYEVMDGDQPDIAWPTLFAESWYNNSFIGDFDLKNIPSIVIGSLIGNPPIPTRKNINGICINIDCTLIGSVCDQLEGC
jgi:hypothetical protein